MGWLRHSQPKEKHLLLMGVGSRPSGESRSAAPTAEATLALSGEISTLRGTRTESQALPGPRG